MPRLIPSVVLLAGLGFGCTSTHPPLRAPTDVSTEWNDALEFVPTQCGPEGSRLFVSATELTVSQYRKVWSAIGPDAPSPASCMSLEYPEGLSQNDLPMGCINFNTAEEIARVAERILHIRSPTEMESHEVRLPTLNEWKCFVGDSNATCTDANLFDRTRAEEVWLSDSLRERALECSDGFPRLSPVGALQSNELGLHDTIGNVWEWVTDPPSMVGGSMLVDKNTIGVMESASDREALAVEHIAVGVRLVYAPTQRTGK